MDQIFGHFFFGASHFWNLTDVVANFWMENSSQYCFCFLKTISFQLLLCTRPQLAFKKLYFICYKNSLFPP